MLDSGRFVGCRRRAFLLALACLVAAAGRAAAAPPPPARADVVIFAAASLQTALDALTPQAERATGVHLRIAYAASSALARQIESGAPADLFVSADLDWMDYLADRRLIQAASRVNLAGNALVLVASKAHPVTLAIAPGFAIAAALGNGRLALADPDAVPAGKYARAALTSLGVWPAVEHRIAPAADVRAALRLVARDEAPLGIVYRSDAVAEPDVVMVGTFPEGTHPPIVYPMALTATAGPGAPAVLAFLRTDAARKVLDAQGFTKPPRD